jgi:hypothetical protein
MAFKFDMKSCAGTTSAMQQGKILDIPKMPTTRDEFERNVIKYLNDVILSSRRNEKKKIVVELFRYFGETDYVWETMMQLVRVVVEKFEQFALTEPQEYMDVLKGFVWTRLTRKTNVI